MDPTSVVASVRSVVPKLDQCFSRPFFDIIATKKAAEVLSSMSCVVLFFAGIRKNSCFLISTIWCHFLEVSVKTLGI